MDWYKYLDRPLQDSAYRAGIELAWSKSDALKIVRLLKDKGYVVLGVDVWIPTENGPTIPTPFVYDWSLGQDTNQPERRATAFEFIESFEWDPSDQSHQGRPPYFNILAKLRSG
jgi:hypothetical protein